MRIEPAPSEWSRLVASSPGFGSDRARIFRAQAGLPVDRPVIMTGHQPEFWHPGILAKYLACEAALPLGAPAWVVPDQDEVEPATLRVPVSDATGALRVRRVAFAPPPPPGVPACSLPPITPSLPEGDSVALPSVSEGIAAIRAALAAHSSAPSLAHQAQGALASLLTRYLTPAPTVFATDLCRTDLFASILSRMADDPAPMSRAYNDAVAAHPEAGVQRLIASDMHDRWELPLWRVQPGEPRRRVYAEQVSDIPREQLAPRALLMTAILRMAGCDLFIHGAGGEAYDRVTEQWIRGWLGEPLAASAVVTATLRLPLRESTPDEEQVARAVWREHAAQHDPEVVGLHALASRKRELATAIASYGRHDPARAELFREMHALLEEYRSTHQAALAQVEAEAESARTARAERDIVLDRTWAFPLYSDSAIRGMKAEIGAAFEGVGASMR